MRTIAIRIVACVLLLAPVVTLASGTYRGGPPRTPSSIDREAYDQGKAVFTGKAAPADQPGDADAQRARLEAWLDKLPERAKTGTDLVALAGKLSDEQMKALEYYIGVRYKVK